MSLKNLRQKEQETIEEFGTRVHEALDQGIEAGRLKYNNEGLKAIKDLLTEEATDGFLNGLNNDSIMLLLSKDDIGSLTTAIKLASKLEHKIKRRNEPIDSKISANKIGVFTVNAK